MAALPEQRLRMGFLEISGADLGRRYLRCDAEHGHSGAMAIEQAIDEMEVAGSAATGANGEVSRQVRFGPRREGGHFLVPNMDPFDLALAPQRVGQPVQAVAHDTIDTLYAGGGENLRELVGYGSGHVIVPLHAASTGDL